MSLESKSTSQVRGSCPECHGRGVLAGCSFCHGGSLEESEELLVELPAGLHDGPLPSRGSDGQLTDVLCLIQVQGHKRFRRRGDDLHMAAGPLKSLLGALSGLDRAPFGGALGRREALRAHGKSWRQQVPALGRPGDHSTPQGRLSIAQSALGRC